MRIAMSGEALHMLLEVSMDRAVEPLIQALKDEDIFVSSVAAFALRNINGTRAVELMIQAMKDEDRYVRESQQVLLEIPMTREPSNF